MANLAAAAARPRSITSLRVPSLTGRSGFGQFGTNLANIIVIILHVNKTKLS